MLTGQLYTSRERKKLSGNRGVALDIATHGGPQSRRQDGWLVMQIAMSKGGLGNAITVCVLRAFGLATCVPAPINSSQM